MSTATLSQARKPKPTTRLPWAFVVLIALAACLLVLAFGFIAFQIYFSARVLPGVSVWNVDLSGKSLDEAAAALDAAFKAKFNTARVDLSDGQQAWIANPIDLGIYFDARATAQAALELSQRGVEGQTQVLLNGADLAPAHRLQPRPGARLLRADGRADQSPAARCRFAAQRHDRDHHARADRARVERGSGVETAAGPRQDRRAEAHRAADRYASSRTSPMCPPWPRACSRCSIAT